MSRRALSRNGRRPRGKSRVLERKRRRLLRVKRRLFLFVLMISIFALLVVVASAFVRGCSRRVSLRRAEFAGPTLPDDVKWIDGVNWIFAEQDTSVPKSRIGNQWVRVLEEERNWYRVETIQGSGWMRRNFSPTPEGISELIEQYGVDLGLYFENLETGFVFQSNGGQVFYSASTMKAVQALYLYQQAENGTIDLGEFIPTYVGGSTMNLTLAELLRLNVSESDNVASNTLADHFGREGVRTFINELDVEVKFEVERIMQHSLIPRDAGLFMREIFTYIESDGRYSQDFKNHLLNNQYPFIVSDYPVASKTGWFPSIAWHDMAIVYAESPYILVILTARDGWEEQDYQEFAEISMAFQEFNRIWFVDK